MPSSVTTSELLGYTFKYKWSRQVYKEGQNMAKSKWKTNATTNKVKVQMSLEFMMERRLECCTSCWQGKRNPQEISMGGVDIFIVLLRFSICPFLRIKFTSSHYGMITSQWKHVLNTSVTPKSGLIYWTVWRKTCLLWFSSDEGHHLPIPFVAHTSHGILVTCQQDRRHAAKWSYWEHSTFKIKHLTYT